MISPIPIWSITGTSNWKPEFLQASNDRPIVLPPGNYDVTVSPKVLVEKTPHATLRFTAKAGRQYQVKVDARPHPTERNKMLWKAWIIDKATQRTVSRQA